MGNTKSDLRNSDLRSSGSDFQVPVIDDESIKRENPCITKLKSILKDTEWIKENIKEIKTDENGMKLLRYIKNNIDDASTEHIPQHISHPKPSETKKNISVCVYRTETATTSFPSFETDFQRELDNYLTKNGKAYSLEVRKVIGINEVKELKTLKIIILCAFASASRVEAETVLPMHTLFQKELPECKVICVVFRYGENAPSAKILSSKSNKEEEAIPSTSCNFTSSGIINESAMKLIANIKSKLK